MVTKVPCTVVRVFVEVSENGARCVVFSAPMNTTFEYHSTLTAEAPLVNLTELPSMNTMVSARKTKIALESCCASRISVPFAGIVKLLRLLAQ